ncbi:sigma-70 family RNA polymerase sigma factor [Sinomonas halotolerans]|uniref:Sigma-70 family RNA polymerase sigma factor n=1 Tax=Sinomonas halotolerans TaxID=1644133 RepID=A0ABU9X1P1_9MICC
MARSAQDELVLEHLPLVGYIVNETCARAPHLPREDLAGAGAVALTAAARSFDPTLGVPFGAYARQRIRGAVADELRSSDWATRGARRRIKESRAAEERLTRELGRVPSVDELASALGVDRAEVEAARADGARTVESLDEAFADSLHDAGPSPEGAAVAGERDGYVRAAVAALPERMRHVVAEVYFGDRTVTELAAELGTTASAVSHLRREALRMLHDALARHYEGSSAAPTAKGSAGRVAEYLDAVGEATAGGLTRSLARAG